MPWTLNIELDQEEDGRWIADIPALPGTQCYGGTRAEAMAHVQALALRVLAERLDHNEARVGFPPDPIPGGLARRRVRVP